jgi:hypothetical protein
MAIVATLTLTGVLASVALGDSCVYVVRWNDVLYTGQATPFALPEPGRKLGEGALPRCGEEGGACAPPEEAVAVFALRGVPSAVAIVDGGSNDAILLAPGTFPELRDHPLHEAVYGLPSRPNHRSRGCGGPFTLTGEVARTDRLLWIDVDHAGGAGADLAGEETQIELDANTRIKGFDVAGVATLRDGDTVSITARVCRMTEADWPLADLIERGGP